MNSPAANIIIFFPTLPLDVEEIIKILKNNIAANSGGPINNAIKAIGPIRRIVTISLEKSAITEENNAVSSAFLPFPIFVKGGPSKVVATDAPVPGNEIRIAGIEPPKIPPLYTPIKKGIPTKGSIKNDIGSTIAIAIKVVNPGNAPTNKPIKRPKAITKIIVRKLPLPKSKGKELKKLSNIYSPYIIKKLPIRISKNGNAGKKTCIMLTKIKKTVTGKINAIKVTNFKFTFPI